MLRPGHIGGMEWTLQKVSYRLQTALEVSKGSILLLEKNYKRSAVGTSTNRLELHKFLMNSYSHIINTFSGFPVHQTHSRHLRMPLNAAHLLVLQNLVQKKVSITFNSWYKYFNKDLVYTGDCYVRVRCFD